MQVKITKVSGHYYWYKNEIGKVYDVLKKILVFKDGTKNYKVKGGNGRHIDVRDCEVVEEGEMS
ncbi:MAG: hypothetical protein WC677_07720 [Clostridia bacterium]|jgi:hypothetical protein